MKPSLLVDIGNTSLKIGFSSPDEVLHAYTLPTDSSQSGDGLGLVLTQLLAHAGFGGVARCLVSSVVPGMEPILTHACSRFLGVEPRYAARTLPVPLHNGYENPAEVGPDRLVAAFAARRLLPEPSSVISVDFGTATTFDCVSGEAYLGGLICPGVMSALGALATRTARLPRIALACDDKVPIVGRNTVTSLNHGFLFGFAAMTEGLCARLAATLPGPVAVVATGGFAEAVARVSSCVDLLRPDLILEGLRLLGREAAD